MGGLHTHALGEHVTGDRVRQYYSTSLYQLESLHEAEDRGHECSIDAVGGGCSHEA